MEAFSDLPGEVQDYMIVTYHANSQIESIIIDEKNREIERQNKAKGKR